MEKSITNLNISGKRVIHPGKPDPRPIPTPPPLLVVEPSLPPSLGSPNQFTHHLQKKRLITTLIVWLVCTNTNHKPSIPLPLQNSMFRSQTENVLPESGSLKTSPLYFVSKASSTQSFFFLASSSQSSTRGSRLRRRREQGGCSRRVGCSKCLKPRQSRKTCCTVPGWWLPHEPQSTARY